MNRRAGELSTCSSTNLPSGYADGSPLLGVNSVTVPLPVTTTMVSPMMPDHSAGFAEIGRPTMVPSLQSGQLLGVHVSAAIKEKIWNSQYIDLSLLYQDNAVMAVATADKGSALTTGSFWNSDCSVRTEIYDFGTNQWNDAPDYPFSS